MLSLPQLLANGHVVAPGAYDALTALLVARAGFPAIYLGGSSIAYTQLGRPDVGFVGYRDVLERLRVIRDRVDLPVIVDADTGFGGVVAVHRTVVGLEAAGAAAIQIEDQVSPKRCGHLQGRRVEPVAVMVAKVLAAVDARRSPEFLVIARTDALAVDGLAAAVERSQAYLAAGCDLVYVEGPRDEAEMRAITSQVGGRHAIDMVEGGRIPLLPAERLASIGYDLIIYPNAITRALVPAAESVLTTLRTEGTTASLLDAMTPFDELQEMLGLPELLAYEASLEDRS
jgi:2-methylisocitrate lyase-like PEP mutase family enzyme